MKNKVNAKFIIDTMSKWVEESKSIPPSLWVDAAAKLNLFIGNENEILYKLENNVAVARYELLKEGDMTVAKAKAYVEASDDYMEYRKQGAYVKQIQEFVRIAKKQATLSETEFKGY